MVWVQNKKAFRAKLNNQAGSFLSAGLSPAERDRRNKMVVKGRQFLSSIDQLRSILYDSYFINNEFWENFLEAATQALPPNDHCEENYRTLCRYVNTLNFDMNKEPQAKINKNRNVHKATKFFCTGLSSAFAFTSGAVMLISLAAGIGSFTMGPWGVAALGVALTLIGALLTLYCAYQIYKSVRFCKGSQLKEINDFVEHLNPNAEEVTIYDSLEDSQRLYPFLSVP